MSLVFYFIFLLFLVINKKKNFFGGERGWGLFSSNVFNKTGNREFGHKTVESSKQKLKEGLTRLWRHRWMAIKDFCTKSHPPHEFQSLKVTQKQLLQLHAPPPLL